MGLARFSPFSFREIIGKSAAGVWAGKEDYLVQWTSNGWLFASPFEGLSVWAVTGGRGWRFSAGRWTDAMEAASIRIAGKQVVGAQQPPIALPQGGTNATVCGNVRLRGSIAGTN